MKICEEILCTGCGSCRNICPVNAISMQEDCDGRPIAQIDSELCIACGMCEEVCPSNQPLKRIRPDACYAAWLKDDAMKSASSSGGAAIALSIPIIEAGGVVFGAKWNKRIEVEHAAAETIEGLIEFCGSKYVQSETGLSYSDAKGFLEKGRKVLYIGTPCQIAGLKCFLNRDYNGLFTVDLICHGVPPARYWNDYLSKIVDISSVSSASFRDSSVYRLLLSGNSKVLYSKTLLRDYYYIAFMYALSYRENCYSCPYANQERIADITIGDFWGLDRKSLAQRPQGSISIILLNTDKGYLLFEKAKPQLFFEERAVEEGIAGNAQLRSPSLRHPDRDLFLKTFRQKGFVRAVKATSLHQMYLYNNMRHLILLPLKMIRSLINGWR